MRLLTYIFGLLLLIGCQNVRQPERPDDLISQDKMVAIFYDAYMANAAKSINNRKLREFGIRLDSVIYQKHDVDSLQFAKSNEYYSLDLDNYASIFTEVESRLREDQIVYDSIKESLQSENKAIKARVDKDRRSEGKEPVILDSNEGRKRKSLIPSIQASVEIDSLE